MTQVWELEEVRVNLGKTGEHRVLNPSKFSAAVLDHVFNYGLRQIINDAMAPEKDDDKKVALADKRIENLINGTLRASPVREGDPVRKRAMELAETRIKGNKAYIAWLQASGLKLSDKDAVAKLRELAKAAIEKDGNPFMAQAKIDVEAAKALDDIDLELDLSADDEDEED